MYKDVHKEYPVTGVTFSAYHFHAKKMLHKNRAIHAIRKNDWKTLKDIMEADPSVHHMDARMPIIFYAIKYRKPICFRAILQSEIFHSKKVAIIQILSWMSRNFNYDTYMEWKNSVHHHASHIHLMLFFAVSDSKNGDKNNKKAIQSMVKAGADPDSKICYPMTAREYATNSVSYTHLTLPTILLV